MKSKKSNPASESNNQIFIEQTISPDFLLQTAAELVRKLNSTSESIQKIEDGLREMNANFPFRHLVWSGEESINKIPEERHEHASSYYTIDGYYTKRGWYLSWEEDEESKDNKYRLFLVETEQEFIFCYETPNGRYWETFFDENIIFKKPLRQTKISKRLRVADRLQSFIAAFRAELVTYLNKIHEIELLNEMDDEYLLTETESIKSDLLNRQK